MMTPLAMLGTSAALTLVLWLLLRQPRRELGSTALALLRCVLPSWRFFEEIADVPVLSHRLITVSGASGPWVQTLCAPRRHLGMWGLNAAGNLYLAYQSLLEQLASELSECAETAVVTRTVSYQLVRALVVQRLRRDEGVGLAGHYQFRLTGSDEPALPWTSPVHAL